MLFIDEQMNNIAFEQRFQGQLRALERALNFDNKINLFLQQNKTSYSIENRLQTEIKNVKIRVSH